VTTFLRAVLVAGIAALPGASAAGTLDEAQRLFYSARYEAAAATALEVRVEEPGNLAASELRSSALLFQLRRALGDLSRKDIDKDKAWKACAECPGLLAAFQTEIDHGRSAARARLAADPADDDARFFLGKLDLNYVWLQLGTLGRRTGWSEYWEARSSLDELLKRRPDHVRARVARAWIDYIVGTKMPRGVRWMLGGGNKKKGLLAVREAAAVEGDPYVQAEAGFALWDMQVREKQLAEAVTTARDLARDFPENPELVRFIQRHQGIPTAEAR
jgi:hypothetical protein